MPDLKQLIKDKRFKTVDIDDELTMITSDNHFPIIKSVFSSNDGYPLGTIYHDTPSLKKGISKYVCVIDKNRNIKYFKVEGDHANVTDDGDFHHVVKISDMIGKKFNKNQVDLIERCFNVEYITN